SPQQAANEQTRITNEHVMSQGARILCIYIDDSTHIHFFKCMYTYACVYVYMHINAVTAFDNNSEPVKRDFILCVFFCCKFNKFALYSFENLPIATYIHR